MHTILSIGKSILFLLSLLLAEIFVGYILPEPLSYIHVGSIAITLYILLKERGRIVWYIFIFSFLQELLFPSDIYGAMLLAGTLSALTAYWIHKFFLTNKSMLTGILLGVITIFSYRIWWFLYQIVVFIVSDTMTKMPQWSFYILSMEVIVSEIAIILLLLIFQKKKDIV
jgi:hypothetical protein